MATMYLVAKARNLQAILETFFSLTGGIYSNIKCCQRTPDWASDPWLSLYIYLPPGPGHHIPSLDHGAGPPVRVSCL